MNTALSKDLLSRGLPGENSARSKRMSRFSKTSARVSRFIWKGEVKRFSRFGPGKGREKVSEHDDDWERAGDEPDLDVEETNSRTSPVTPRKISRVRLSVTAISDLFSPTTRAKPALRNAVSEGEQISVKKHGFNKVGFAFQPKSDSFVKSVDRRKTPFRHHVPSVVNIATAKPVNSDAVRTKRITEQVAKDKEEIERAKRIAERSEKLTVEREEAEVRKKLKEEKRNTESDTERRKREEKADVKVLKAFFDEHKIDGVLELDGFQQVLKKLTLEQLLGKRKHIKFESWDKAEETFHDLDLDGDGKLDFSELLRIFFPTAPQFEINEKLNLVGVVPKEVLEQAERENMQAEERAARRVQIVELFVVYDEKKVERLTRNQMVGAMSATGMSREDIDNVFDEYCVSDDQFGPHLTQEEFVKMMEDSGAFQGPLFKRLFGD